MSRVKPYGGMKGIIHGKSERYFIMHRNEELLIQSFVDTTTVLTYRLGCRSRFSYVNGMWFPSKSIVVYVAKYKLKRKKKDTK